MAVQSRQSLPFFLPFSAFYSLCLVLLCADHAASTGLSPSTSLMCFFDSIVSITVRQWLPRWDADVWSNQPGYEVVDPSSSGTSCKVGEQVGGMNIFPVPIAEGGGSDAII